MVVELKETKYIKDDPIRPYLSIEWRTQPGRKIYSIYKEDSPAAIICTALTTHVPTDEEELETYTSEKGKIAIFYTVWSYEKGAGREIVFDVAKHMVENFNVTRLITLSPKTEMAKRFHLKNGAFVLQENQSSINYEYPKEAL